MNIEISMLNVQDADAIIVHLTKSEKEQLVILIDGGHPGDGERIGEMLDVVLAKAGKAGPDLVICTHYDEDHIGGLYYIAQKYGAKIKEFWIHEHELVKDAAEIAEKILALRNHPPRIMNFEQHSDLNEMRSISNVVLESYPQMVKLVDYLNFNKINIVQPFSGTTLAGWENEIRVLGPTKDFYDHCIPRIKHSGKGLIKENIAQRLKLNNIFERASTDGKTACEILGNTNKHVTLINQISIILLIIVDDNKYLFTGDASLDSFKKIPDYEKELANIYWLKVPHHGSRNNSSPEMFDIMKPTYADISGGPQYLDDEVPKCLSSKGVIVRSTFDLNTDLIFPY